MHGFIPLKNHRFHHHPIITVILSRFICNQKRVCCKQASKSHKQGVCARVTHLRKGIRQRITYSPIHFSSFKKRGLFFFNLCMIFYSKYWIGVIKIWFFLFNSRLRMWSRKVAFQKKKKKSGLWRMAIDSNFPHDPFRRAN